MTTSVDSAEGSSGPHLLTRVQSPIVLQSPGQMGLTPVVATFLPSSVLSPVPSLVDWGLEDGFATTWLLAPMGSGGDERWVLQGKLELTEEEGPRLLGLFPTTTIDDLD